MENTAVVEPIAAPNAAPGRILGWAPVAIAVIGVLIAAYLVLRPTSAPSLIGRAAPGFILSDTQGRPVSLAALRGHPVLINFWGVNCIYCRTEMPLLQQAAVRYRAQGLVILGVDVQNDDAPSITQFAAERNVTYAMLLDAGNKVAASYGVDPLPESFFVDRQGFLRRADPKPFLDPDSLHQALATIL